MQRRFLLLTALTASWLTTGAPLAARAAADKSPFRSPAGLPPGGSADVIARQLASFQFVVASGPQSGVRDIAEMLAKAKADPSTATCASSGNGTVPHRLGQLVGEAAAIEFQHLRLEGGASAMRAPTLPAELTALGLDTIGSGPEQLAPVQRAGFARWAEPLKASGFQAD